MKKSIATPTPDPALTAFPVAPAPVPPPASPATVEQIAAVGTALDAAPVPEDNRQIMPPLTAEQAATLAGEVGIKTIASDEPLTNQQLKDLGFDPAPEIPAASIPEPAPTPAEGFPTEMSEQTRLEVMAGRKTLTDKGVAPGPLDFSERAKTTDPTFPEKPQANVPLNFGGIPESTALEQEAGRQALARRRNDYEDVLRKQREANAKNLNSGADAKPSDLDYPKG